MFMIPLDNTSTVPLYEQIYQYVKNEIRMGKLTVGTKLPSSRSLSSNLLISRTTVELAYSQLTSEGYIRSIPKSGYYVLRIGDLVELSEKATVSYEKKVDVLESISYDFSPYSVDITQLPSATLRRLYNQCMNDMNQQLFLLGDSQGDFPLREAIGRYLHSSRGVNVEPSQIIVGAGTDYLLQLLAQILKPQRKIAMENPTYLRAYRIFSGLDFEVSRITVNKDGMDLESLSKDSANLCYITPTNQYPLGVIMPINRRMQLLSWALEQEDRYIIEDDHDSEFRYKGKPIPSLQGLDRHGRVIYIGTFSRAIAPGIRMGYMVLPKQLASLYQQTLSYYACTLSRIDQAMMCEFINGGFFERHVNKMRTRYKAKHDALLRALKVFGNLITVTGECAGLHVVIKFHIPWTEEELIQVASKAGIRLYGLNRHFISGERTKDPTILLGFANLTEEKIEKGVHKLFELIKNSI